MRRIGLAAAGGFLVAFSLPPWGWWPLAFAGPALLELALGARPSARTRFAGGMAFGLVWMAMGMAWMWQLTVPGYIATILIFASWHGVAELVAPPGRWGVIGRPAAHSLVEALRFSFPFGGVPLASLGIAQAAGPLAGIARVGGVILITWVVFQVGFALGALIAAEADLERRGPERLATGALLAAVAVLALALVAPRGSGTGELVDVAAVQGGGEQGTRAIDVPTRIVTDRHVEATRSIEPDESLDLVLWPENVIDTVDFATSEQLQLVAAEAARLGVPVAVGVTEDVPDQPGRVTNAQVVVTPDGRVTSRYDKVRRVPFGEYVPLRGLLEAVGAPVDQVPTNAVAGTGPAVIELPDGTRLAVVISWEVFFGGRVREGVKHGGQAILNPTNGASYTGTIVQTQQVASSRLRAIETGRWLVQVSPTGFSELVTPDGDVIDRTAVSERAIVRGVVELRTGRTWYVNLGDAPFIAALALVFAGSWFAARRERSSGAHRSSSTVTGPSLTSATSISAPKRPVATDAPSRRSSATSAATIGSACSGRAAASQLGRRPLVVSP
jgi:apolipoprotein N-acyltransferase